MTAAAPSAASIALVPSRLLDFLLGVVALAFIAFATESEEAGFAIAGVATNNDAIAPTKSLSIRITQLA